MIEVDLRPGRGRGGRERRRFSRPISEWAPGWYEFRADPWHWAFVACAVIAPLVVGLTWYAQWSEMAGLRAEREEARADSAQLAGRSTLGDSLSDLRRAVAERIGRVRALDRDRYVWPRLMDELGRSLPAAAWLTSLETERTAPDLAVRIEGMASTPLEITAYVRALETSPLVEGVRIRGSRRVALERGYAQSFGLSVSVRQPPPERRRTRTVAPPGEG